MIQVNRAVGLGLVMALATLPVAAGGFGHGHKGHGDGMHVERMAARLGLDDAQREAVTAVVEKERAARSAQREAMREARKALRGTVHAGAVDEAAIRKAAAEVGRLEGELAVARARMLAAIREVLTPEQREQLEALHEERRERREERRERRMERRERRDPGGAEL